MVVRIDTRPFELSHQRQPRGQGGWLFAFGDEDDQSQWRNFNGTFAEARQQAKEAAKAEGVQTVKVLP